MDDGDDDDDEQQDHSHGHNQAPLHVLPPHLTTDARGSLSELDSTLLKVGYLVDRHIIMQ